MDKEMQAKHKGYFESRTWHKIRWTDGLHAGKIDLFTDEDLAKHKNIEIIESFKTEKCATGAPFAFGVTGEDKIDAWIRENRR